MPVRRLLQGTARSVATAPRSLRVDDMSPFQRDWLSRVMADSASFLELRLRVGDIRRSQRERAQLPCIAAMSDFWTALVIVMGAMTRAADRAAQPTCPSADRPGANRARRAAADRRRLFALQPQQRFRPAGRAGDASDRARSQAAVLPPHPRLSSSPARLASCGSPRPSRSATARSSWSRGPGCGSTSCGRNT